MKKTTYDLGKRLRFVAITNLFIGVVVGLLAATTPSTVTQESGSFVLGAGFLLAAFGLIWYGIRRVFTTREFNMRAWDVYLNGKRRATLPAFDRDEAVSEAISRLNLDSEEGLKVGIHWCRP